MSGLLATILTKRARATSSAGRNVQARHPAANNLQVRRRAQPLPG
jgi:hypothetical protein